MQYFLRIALIIIFFFYALQAEARNVNFTVHIDCSQYAKGGKDEDSSQEKECLSKKAYLEKKQQQRKLRNLCLTEAVYTEGRSSFGHQLGHALGVIQDSHIDSMKSLCKDMTNAYMSEDKEEHAFLASKCSKQIQEERNSNPENIDHFNKLKDICEQMTDQKINTDIKK